jgi:ATP-dependent DNA helicase RecQ
VANEDLDAFVKLVLRTYTGLFTDYVTIYEDSLAAKAGVDAGVIRKYLNRLNAAGVVRYLPQKKNPVIIFTEERLDADTLHFSKEHYKDRKERTGQHMKAVLEYARQDQVCRSQYLLSYFGERRSGRCGQCDVCMKRDKLDLSRYELDMAVEEIRENLSSGTMDLNQLVESGSLDEEKTIRVIRWLLDNGRLERNDDNMLRWHKRK